MLQPVTGFGLASGRHTSSSMLARAAGFLMHDELMQPTMQLESQSRLLGVFAIIVCTAFFSRGQRLRESRIIPRDPYSRTPLPASKSHSNGSPRLEPRGPSLSYSFESRVRDCKPSRHPTLSLRHLVLPRCDRRRPGTSATNHGEGNRDLHDASALGSPWEKSISEMV